jgi:NtrC-family two-component system sensor histidine kinase KinB
MKLPFLINNSLFKKLFLLIFLAAVLPIGLSFIYLVGIANSGIHTEHQAFSVVFYGAFLFAVYLAAVGAYYFSKHLSAPITHFIKSATEIARGDFNQRVPVESSDEIGRLARIFNYMVTELRRLDQMNLNKIINEKNKTETILKNVADGVIVTDPANKVMLMNFVAEAWFGVSDHAFAGEPVETIVSDESLLELIHMTAVDDKKKPRNIEITLKSGHGGKPVVLQGRAARIISEKKELIGIVSILRDITREKEIDRLKTELVSMVAHELRSPLTCISGFSELLLDTSITRDQSEEYASIIMKESNRLSDLINKFLDISKIESGKSQLRKTPVDLKMLIEKVLDFNAQLADRKKIKVKFEAPDQVSIIHLDRDMIEQVVLNLYSNAVKYSPEKTRITVRLQEIGKAMHIDFSDTGYGIPESALPHIFDKFYRITDDENLRDIAGSGLGLALVKEIVEIHSGTIDVESTVGKGSTFFVVLPFKSVVKNIENESESMLLT